ncbi:folate-binding protein YgfZ [Opitutus sp. ER46]|uniref:CAF17-like 4Fe-4S cluster assembly/insertion protein YgfZ n=1 Tax=Opitutus sp. ER46 TaxID=2161864 RepID=UPI000D323463|nr:folate-binding protein YgfZ [Opitutus sp. ER46]PTX98436.1 folate-binding protein [Opitutus sp. ER46]
MNSDQNTELLVWKPACWLRVSGPDAAEFLQGQFTNDLRRLLPGEAVYGLWLSVKGKVIADSHVLRGAAPDEFWVGSVNAPAAVVRERLESHIIADDVCVEDQTEAWAGLTVFGAERVTVEAAAGSAGPAGGGFVFAGRRSRDVHWEWIFPAAQATAARAALGNAVELTPDEVERRRILAEIPAVPADIGPNDLPNEGGLDVDAISYTKGCYLGQEIMSRLKSMGQIRRRLVRVSGAGPRPPLPAPLHAGERLVGELRSTAASSDHGWIGLALLTRTQVAAGATLGLAPGEPGVVQVEETP